MDEEKIKALYDDVYTEYEVGTIDEFKAYLSDDAKRQAFFTDVVSPRYEVASIDEFESAYGLKKKDQPQQPQGQVQEDITSTLGATDAVIGDQTRDGVSGSVELTEGQGPPEFKFSPEEEAGSRYKQAGEPYLPNIIKGLRDRIKEQEERLIEARSTIYRTPTGVEYTGNKSDINSIEADINKRRELLRSYSEQKDKIDSSYASDILGEGEAVKDIQEAMDFERGLEGDVYDFFSRGFSALVSSALPPAANFETGAVKKQKLKESLEEVIDLNIKASAKRVVDQKSAYENTAKEIGDAYKGQVEALNEEFLSGDMHHMDYKQAYEAIMESASKDEAELNNEYQRYASMGDLYLKSLENLSMTNQYDDLNPLESGTKSFANEILKTPRQAAGLMMATAPLMELIGNPTIGIPAGIPTESYLDGMSPITDYLTALTEENLLRIDPDDTKANLTGEITGQLAKIVPAAAAAPAAGVLVSAGMSFDEMYQSTKGTEGLTDAEAVKLAAIYTPIGTAMEYFGARTAIGAVNKKVALETAKRIAIQQGLLGIGKKEATIALQNTLFKELGINMTKEFFEEGITESLQTAAQEGIKQLKNVQRGETIFEFDGGEFFDNMIESFLIGGIAGAGAAGVFTTIGMGGKQKSGFQTYKETLLNDNIYNTLTKQIMESKLTDTQKQTAIKTMERDAEILRSVDDIGLTETEQERAAGLISRKVTLEEFVNGKDPSITANIREEIKDIKDALKQFEAKVETQDAVSDPMSGADTEEVNVKPDETVEEVSVEPDPISQGVVVEETGETVQSVPPKKVSEASETEVYTMNGERGVIREDGQTIVFETDDTIVELGNKNEIAERDIAEFGIEQEAPLNIEVQPDNSVNVEGTKYVNNFSDPQAAINYDQDGNVLSINLETEGGQKRTIRGQRAQEIAYQYKLKEFEQNATEETVARLEQQVEVAETTPIEVKPEEKKRVARRDKPKVVAQKPNITTTTKPKPTPPKSRQVGAKEVAKKGVSEPTRQKSGEKPKQTTETDGKEKRPVLEDAQASRDKAEGRKDSPELRSEKEKVESQKQKAFDSIDKIAEELKKRLAVKLPDGVEVTKQGFEQNDLIDLAANMAKAVAETGIELNAAIQKVVKELRDMGALAKEDVVDFEAATKAKIEADQPLPTQKQTEKQLEQQEKEVSKEADEKLNSLKNESLAEGMEEVYEAERNALRMNTQEMIDMGKDAVTSGRINPIALIEGILANPRALQVEEQAALLYYKVKLNNEISTLAEQVNKARDAGNQEARSLYGIQFAEKMAQFEALEKSTLLSGVKQGQSLYFRRLMVDSMYNLASQVNIYKAITGNKTVPVEVQEKFKRYDEELKELNKKIDDYEKRLKENEGKLFVPQRAERKGGLTQQEKARKAELRGKFFGVMNDASRIAAFLVDKEFYEYSGLVLKEAKGDFTEFSRKMMNSVGKGIKKHLPKLYKDLGGKGETKFDAKQPEIDQDGTLFIPDEFIIDLIENGFDKIETIVPEIVSIMKMNGVEVSERQVRDAISDYGKRTTLSGNDIDVIIRKMKRAGKLISALEDVRRKKKPLRSGRERDEKTDQERELQRKINILLRDIPQTNEEIEGRWRSALAGVKARMENRIKDIQKQLKTGEKTPKRNPIALDAEAQLLKKELDYYVELLKAAEGPRKMTDEQRVNMIQNGLERRKAELEQRIRDKRFDPEVRAEKVTTPAIEKLRKEIEALNEQYKELEKKEAPNLAIERKNEQRKKALDNKIGKLKDQLTNKVVEQSKKEAEIPKNAAVLEAERQVKQLREEIKQLDEYKAMAERKKLELLKKNAQKSIDRYQQRIKDGDFETKKPIPVQLDEEGKRLKIQQQRWKNKFDLEREKAKLENRAWGQKFFDNFLDVWNVPRSLMASVDLSAPLRQGFLLSVRNPRAAAKAFGQMFQQMRSEEKYEAWLDMVEQDPDYVFAKSVGLYIAKPNSVLMAKEEQFMSSIASRIPIYGTVLVRGSERAYSAYLNVLRMNVWKGFVRNMEIAGLDKEADKINYKYMAKFINNATGRGDLLGAGEQTEKVLNSMFFAPRYVMSRFNIISNTLTGYAMYPKAVRIEALKTVAAYISTGLGIMALALAAGADVEDDPRSTDFGKIRFGDLRLDIWAGFQQPVRLMVTMLTRQKKSIITGEIKDLNIDKFGSGTVYDEAHRFVRTKFSPVASLFADYLSAPQDVKQEGIFGYEESVLFKNVVGQNMTASEKLLGMVAPLYLQDMDEIYSSGGPMMAAGVLFPAMFGIGAQYYAPDKIDAANTTLEEAENFDFDDLELDEFDFDLDDIEFQDTDF